MTVLEFPGRRGSLVNLGDVAGLIATRERPRGIWRRGVLRAALELLERFPDERVLVGDVRRILLDGSRDWHEYSASGRALADEEDIARRYLTPRRFESWREGSHPHIDLVMMQARALHEACGLIEEAALFV